MLQIVVSVILLSLFGFMLSKKVDGGLFLFLSLCTSLLELPIVLTLLLFVTFVVNQAVALFKANNSIASSKNNKEVIE